MRELCHRCQGELPISAAGAGKISEGPAAFEERPLYCPHCGAPQLTLPDHMRTVPAPEPGVTDTTGTVPPPRVSEARPHEVDWPAAISSGAIVAGVGALLVVAGVKVPVASFLSTIWVVGASVIALGLYARKRPLAWVDTGIGLRVGVATGVMMLSAMAVGLAVTGLFVRFGLHRMGGFDAWVTQQMNLMQQQLSAQMQQQQQPIDFQVKMLGFLRSDEVRGGLTIAYAALSAAMIMMFSIGGGAFAGMMRGTRRARMSPR